MVTVRHPACPLITRQIAESSLPDHVAAGWVPLIVEDDDGQAPSGATGGPVAPGLRISNGPDRTEVFIPFVK